MTDYMTTSEASKRWGISSRRINTLCLEGRLPGAYKSKKTWMIPMDAEKPVDKRVKHIVHHLGEESTVNYSSLLHNRMSEEELLRFREEQAVYKANLKTALPIGISDYKKACLDYYYIDKTLLIRDLLEERTQVVLFTRPRRFGKTLNMDMLRVFFEKSEEDTSVYFKDKKIWGCGEKYREYQGKYPVIFVSFKDVKYHTWEDSFISLCNVFSDEAHRHLELRESDKCTDADKVFFEKLLSKDLKLAELAQTFQVLSRMLHMHHGIAPIIIVDEYDIPIQQGHVNGFYKEAVAFVRNLFSGGFKDNIHLSYGFMTGILRVAKESIFSGLNNIRVNSILEEAYSAYFGFTPEEVKTMNDYYGTPEKYQELCAWYDGYRFGNSEIFNPWSVINYFNEKCKPKSYWVSTSSNDIISELIEEATTDIWERLEALLKGESFVISVDTEVIYPQIKNEPSSIFSFLLMTGYLKVTDEEPIPDMEYLRGVALPNKEIANVYKKEILSQIGRKIAMSTTLDVQQALFRADVNTLKEKLEKFLLRTVSFHDTTNESFYHGLVLGLCAMMDSHYNLTSNREAGDGRYDIQLMPKRDGFPGILIELKAEKDATEEQLKQLSQAAIKQMNDRKYDIQMKENGIETIYKYGVAFSGKYVEITCE